MTAWICVTCGQQYAESERPPDQCKICEDERQYVGPDGQEWTTLDELRRRHQADARELEPGLVGIGMRPSFAIGQRALLVQTDAGNLLWDCIPLLDDDIAETVRWAGGIDTIAISHPHYYSTCVEWAHTFEARVLLHEADREWVTRPDPSIEHWSGDRSTPLQGLTLVRLGGHFEGGTVLHWPERQRPPASDARDLAVGDDVAEVGRGLHRERDRNPCRLEVLQPVADALEPRRPRDAGGRTDGERRSDPDEQQVLERMPLEVRERPEKLADPHSSSFRTYRSAERRTARLPSSRTTRSHHAP